MYGAAGNVALPRVPGFKVRESMMHLQSSEFAAHTGLSPS